MQDRTDRHRRAPAWSTVLVIGCVLALLTGCQTNPSNSGSGSADSSDNSSPAGPRYHRPSYSEVDRLVLAFAGEQIAADRDDLVGWLRAHDTEAWCAVEDNEFERRALIDQYRDDLQQFTNELTLAESERTFTFRISVGVGEYDFEAEAFPVERGAYTAYWDYEYDYKDWWNTSGDSRYFSRSARRCADFNSPIFTEWRLQVSGPQITIEQIPMSESRAAEAVKSWEDRTLHGAVEIRIESLSLGDNVRDEPVFSVEVQSVTLYDRLVETDGGDRRVFKGLVHEVDYP